MCDLVLFEVRCTCFYLQNLPLNIKFALFCIFFSKYLVMCSGYALAFYDAVVSSDAALVCTMFDQFPRSYGRKMQPIRFFFCSKNAKKHKKCIFFALFFKKICVCAFFVVPLHSLSKRKYDIRSRCYRLVA